ncbi:hypothetical protein [Pseudooceanicola nanhaiensis]|uniref:hypothetical protein n=1 Tax=Pseudooceanicola nanhaiensis TaxID=375761 RepID=UPI001CD3814B|nr:hypothetical protein [Pseudooceanicola nanhaiensis]MCA0922626.1 hypothetical protein [Pseudooceanicola nanhaiensis]
MSRANHDIIDQLSKLLRDEIAAVGAGRLEEVNKLFPQKSALLQKLQDASPALEKAAQESGTSAERLREKLRAVQELIRSDLAILERMTHATGEIAKELSRLRERQSLNGLYGSTGTTRQEVVAPATQVDQTI